MCTCFSIMVQYLNLLVHFMILFKFNHAVNSTWESLQSHRSWKFLNKFECGESFADRIIGGTNANIGQFPWIVRLGYTNPDDDTIEWLCGGALLSDRHVITAAHCVVESDTEIYKLAWVRLGEHDIQTDPDCQVGVCAPSVQDVRVSNMLRHIKFNDPMYHNDIAMVELQSAVKLHDFVLPICLPQRGQLGQVQVNDIVTVAGWGKTNMTTEERANILQHVQMPIVNNAVCETLDFKSFKLSDGEMCAGGQRNKDACGGDSGGPLMKVFDTETGPKSFLIGIVSFGPTICGVQKPGVYTSVSHFLHWILDHVK